MKRELVKRHRSAVWTIFLGLVVGIVASLGTIPVRTQPASQAGPVTPAFLRPERCYRLTFPIAGVPTWKLLEVLDGGWVRAEVDAGSTSTPRDSAWINTAQVITVREVRCSA